MSITVEDYLGQHGAGHDDELTDEMRADAQLLCDRVNAMLDEFGEDRGLRSGWRPKSINDKIKNAARGSKHITCQAVDVEDNNGELKDWVLQRADDGSYPVLEKYELWAEYGGATPSWLHCQIIPPGSRKRVFFPNAQWAARAAAEGDVV